MLDQVLPYSHFFFLNMMRQMATITTHRPRTAGYAHGILSSGMYRKFIPYQPVMSVRGMKIEVMTVRMVIIRFWRRSICDS